MKISSFPVFFNLFGDYTKAMLEDIKRSKNLNIMSLGGGRT
jgi:hypothetical protein